MHLHDARVGVPSAAPHPSSLALVLGGGGARGAYQAGVLQAIARRYPELHIPIQVGVSAGALNTAYLAAHKGTMPQATQDLVALWLSLTPEQVYRVDARALLSNIVRSGYGLVSGDAQDVERVRGMVDTRPLRAFLERCLDRAPDGSFPGIAHNIARGSLRAVALSATSYTTGNSVTWIEGRDVELWERPQRLARLTRIGVDHVMASAALPLFFPAERVGDEWYGDGGIRLTAPLSPALHLGASRILTISTRTNRRPDEPRLVSPESYPPPAQVLGTLYRSVFLDVIDQDALRLRMINSLVERIPEELRGDHRLIDILVIRPSVDLGKLARDYEPRLPSVFRFLTRGLGTRRSASPDMLSLIMFQEDYLRRLVELGEADAEANAERIDAFMAGGQARAA